MGEWLYESFIDKLRDECLNREVFRNGKEAQTIVEAWRQEYNSYRPHSSLGYLTPAEFTRRYVDNNEGEAKLTREAAGSVSP
jgi:transposase InsO family protein